MPEQDKTPFLDRPGASALIGALAVVLAAVISGVFLLFSGGEPPANPSNTGTGSSTQASPPPPPEAPHNSDPGAPDGPSSDVVVRTLTIPLPDEGTVGLFLDEGKVSTECCDAEFNYGRQDSTGRPELVSNGDPSYSTAVKSETVSREECSQAVATSPTITPIRPLRAGMLICVNSQAGTSLLQIVEAPQPNGTLKLSQKFWPDP